MIHIYLIEAMQLSEKYESQETISHEIIFQSNFIFQKNLQIKHTASLKR